MLYDRGASPVTRRVAVGFWPRPRARVFSCYGVPIMGAALTRIFLDHPREQGETYLEHFAVAASASLSMLVCGAKLAVHAAVPCLFTTAGTDFLANNPLRRAKTD